MYTQIFKFNHYCHVSRVWNKHGYSLQQEVIYCRLKDVSTKKRMENEDGYSNIARKSYFVIIKLFNDYGMNQTINI